MPTITTDEVREATTKIVREMLARLPADKRDAQAQVLRAQITKLLVEAPSSVSPLNDLILRAALAGAVASVVGPPEDP